MATDAPGLSNTIQTPATLDEDVSFLDLQVHLRLDDAAPRTVRAPAIPYDLAVFMPLSWDLKPDLEPDAYFGVALGPNSAVDAGNARDAFQSIGIADASSVYPRVRESIERARQRTLINLPAQTLLPLRSGDQLSISGVKLFLATLHYSLTAVSEAEARDRLALTLDKLLLLNILPALFDATKAALRATPPPADLQQLDKAIWEQFAQSNKLLLEDVRTFLLPGYGAHDRDLTLPFEQWHTIFGQLAPWPNASADQVLFPLSAVDTIAQTALTGLFEAARSGAELAGVSWQPVKDLAAKDPLRRGDYGFFYALADRFWRETAGQDVLGDLNVYKIKYGNAPRLLPFIEEIDLRPTLWVREASALSLERAIATRRRDLALNSFPGLPDKPSTPLDLAAIEQAAQEARLANRTLEEVNRNFAVLNSEANEAGWRVDETTESTTLLGLRERLLCRDVWVTREVRINRTGVRTWTEGYWESRPVFGLFGAILGVYHRVYRTRTRSEQYTWVETVSQSVQQTQTVKPDPRPIETYLKLPIPPQSYTVKKDDGEQDADATKAQREHLARLLGATAAGPLLNNQKDVRVFELHVSGFRDQYGNSLEQVLDEAEAEDKRARLLLLIPELRRRLDGSTENVKYIAVHNPIAPRRSYLEPRVFLVETYRHRLNQDPGHFIGPLSHSVTLFPGESRRMKVVTETRLVTRQQQESRSTQRSAVEQKSNVRNQVKQELNQSEKNAKTSNWSVNTSGGVNLGFVNFGGGASGGQQFQNSSESAAQSINDRVSETLQSASASNEVQVATMSETTLTQTQGSEQIVEFQNVNQGRSVTHKFFQIMHRFDSSVEFWDARIVVESGDQLLPGMNLFRTEVFRLSEIDQMFPELVKTERDATLQHIKALVKKRLEESGIVVNAVPGGLAADRKELERRPRYVNSGACFVDSEVASKPATEPYVEDARKAEIEIQRARAALALKEGEALANGRVVFPREVNHLSVTIPASTASHAAPATSTTDVAPTNGNPPTVAT